MTAKSNDKKKIKVLDKKRLVDSFRYASYGIVEAYKGEQNLRIHTVVAVLVIICGFVFQISYVEWLICLVLIGLVLMSEFFNTAIEYVVDLASPDIHPLAKLAKDTASAGVLMMAIISAIIGLIIFVPEGIEFLGGIL